MGSTGWDVASGGTEKHLQPLVRTSWLSDMQAFDVPTWRSMWQEEALEKGLVSRALPAFSIDLNGVPDVFVPI